MHMTAQFPQFRAVADQALLVEFDHVINEAAYASVMSLDAKLANAAFPGFTESVPAYVSLLVAFDALITDHLAVERAIRALLDTPALPPPKGIPREVEVCYDPDLAPDLIEVARRTGLTEEAVINAHLGQTCQVFMYGFAPGYAYLNGVSPSLHLPRKPSAKRGVPAGSVIIAGGQCLITTLTMPTGWWIIGRSPTRILRDDPDQPFLFNVGDEVRFKRIDRQTFDAKSGTL
jgi:inhibitor of KinA